MLFFKRIFLGLLALGFIFFGGSGTQSNSLFAQAGGLIGLVLGLVVLYIFLKMAWRAMGCLPSFLIFSVVIIFILYAIGAFNDGIGSVAGNLQKFIGQKNSSMENIGLSFVEERPSLQDFGANLPVEEDDIFSEDTVSSFSEDFSSNSYDSHQNNDIINVFADAFVEASPVASPPPTSFDSSMIHASVRVINGDTLAIQGKYLLLFGIDAPEANQTCADRQGRSYTCGKEAALWIRNWISDYEVSCRVMKKDNKGNMTGTCSLGEYDIGAAIVNAGWAIVSEEGRVVYGPYEEQAQINKRGLWQGRFYKPADWRRIQSKKPNIRVINTKPKKKSMFDFMIFKFEYICHNEDETKKLGQELSKVAKVKDIFFLRGDLGMGKTTFARAFIQQLSDAKEVPSPTFTLVQTYTAPELDISHFDLYRLKSPDEVFELGIEDAIYQGVCLIEWPEKLGKYTFKDIFDIEIIAFAESSRKFLITVSSAEKKARLASFAFPVMEVSD